MNGWMGWLTDLMSGGGWVSAPHIQFENALFFIIKQGFTDQHHNCAFFSFFSIDICSRLKCLCFTWIVCICFNQFDLIFLFNVCFMGQKVELRCPLMCIPLQECDFQ